MSNKMSVEAPSLQEFLAEVDLEIRGLREAWRELESGDAAAWSRLQNVAHNLAARARAEKLGVLHACAGELERLGAERLRGAPLDAFFLQCVDGAVEALSLEVAALRRA